MCEKRHILDYLLEKVSDRRNYRFIMSHCLQAWNVSLSFVGRSTCASSRVICYKAMGRRSQMEESVRMRWPGVARTILKIEKSLEGN